MRRFFALAVVSLWAGCLGFVQASEILYESFESLTTGPLKNQNGWVLNYGTSPLVTAGGHVEDQALVWSGVQNGGCRKLLGTTLDPQTMTGPVYVSALMTWDGVDSGAALTLALNENNNSNKIEARFQADRLFGAIQGHLPTAYTDYVTNYLSANTLYMCVMKIAQNSSDSTQLDVSFGTFNVSGGSLPAEGSLTYPWRETMSRSLFNNAGYLYTLTGTHIGINAAGIKADNLLVSDDWADVQKSLFAKPKEYYVATDGDDNNPGTFDEPFRTIQKAATVALAGYTVYIRGGIYRETVTPANQGTAEAPIVFQAYNGEEVIISGGDLVTGWTQHAGDIWKAAVNWDTGTDGAGNTLFVDGQLQFEARHPSTTDPMELGNWGEIPHHQLTSDYFTADDLKNTSSDDYWNGAKVRHHVNDWTVRTSEIADYDDSEGKVTFAASIGVVSQKHILGYYIYDTLKALDDAGEWFKDRAANTLYYQVQPGQNPNDLDIEFKKRSFGFVLDGRDYITIRGITFRGVSIDTDSGTDYNVYQGNTFYGYDKANVGRFGIYGSNTLFRDNEVRQTWGGILSISGTRNELINNYIHDIGYNGTSRVVSMSGTGHFVARNTVLKFARSFLDGYPYDSEFAYNVFEDGANLSWDTGVFDGDGGRGNGGRCIVHHNVFRNTPSIGIYCASYAGLDLTFHHNIVHDISGGTTFTLRTGQLIFGKFYHNTLIGTAPNGDTNASSYAVESNYNNNLQIDASGVTSLGVNCRGNLNYSESDFVDFNGRDFRLAAGSAAIDRGIVLPEINDGYTGAAPDAGALEYGESMWSVGHDFANPPTPTYSWTQLPGTNFFDNGQFKDAPSGWTYIGSPVWFDGNAWNTTGTGLSHAGGYAFQLQPGDGMWRTFTGLKPDTWYIVASETRLTDQVIEVENYNGISGSVTTGNHRNEDYVTGLAEGEWLRYSNIDFGTGGKYNQMELTYTRPAGTVAYSADDTTLEIRLDSTTGQVLDQFEYNPVLADSWNSVQIDIPSVSGLHTVYILPKGPDAATMMLDNIRLQHNNSAPDDKLTIGIRSYGGPTITSRIGKALWINNYERFVFKTGPSSTSAELFIQNDGIYDAYLDRLALYEKDNPAVDAAAAGTAVQSSTLSGGDAANAIDGDAATVSVTEDQPDSFWQVDLGRADDIYQIQLTAPTSSPGRLSNFRVSVWANDPAAGGNPLWQRDYFTNSAPSAGQVLFIKPTDQSVDGLTELQDVTGRFVRVQLLGQNTLGTGSLAIAEAEVRVFDELDWAESDAEILTETSRVDAVFAQIFNIGGMVLVNVDSPDYLELSSFTVSVWDNDPDAGGGRLWQKAYFSGGSVARAGQFAIDGDEIADDGQTRLASVLGRIIRIENNGTNAAGNTELSLADIRVYSSWDVPPASNVAMAGTAAQSSWYYYDNGHEETAINGVILPKDDFTSTQPEQSAWWQVDLQQTPVIDQIVLYNRMDADDRIGNFRVSVWDADPQAGGTELWGKDYSYANGDMIGGIPLQINAEVTSGGIRLDEVVGGRFVRVQLYGSNFLHLAEVQVWKKIEPLNADFNGDRDVNLIDFAYVARCWLENRAQDSNTDMAAAATKAYWPADETDGTVLTDASGNQYNGTLRNGAQWSENGYHGGALKLDGSNDYVKIDTADLCDGQTELTLAAWFRPDTKGDNKGIITCTSMPDQYAGYCGLLLSGYGNGNPVQFRAMGYRIDGPDYSGPVGVWTHAVGVWKSGELFRLYLNGQQVVENDANAPTGSIDMINWYIGSDRLTSGRYFDGLVDDVRIYDYAMSDPQVSVLYHLQSGWPCEQTDLSGDDEIDLDDLAMFAESWLVQ